MSDSFKLVIVSGRQYNEERKLTKTFLEHFTLTRKTFIFNTRLIALEIAVENIAWAYPSFSGIALKLLPYASNFSLR